MLPQRQAYELKHSILEYLKATFSFKDEVVHKAFYDFITQKDAYELIRNILIVKMTT